MKPYQILTKDEKTITLRCKHEKEFPPVHALFDQPIEDQRAMGLIDGHKYEQIKTWQRVCGLKDMAEKCQTCEFAFQEDRRGKLTPYIHQGRVLPPFVKADIGKDGR